MADCEQELNSGPVRRTLASAGLILLATGAVLFLTVVVGIVPEHSFSLGGGSGYKSIAAVAVVGCIMAALGYADY